MRHNRLVLIILFLFTSIASKATNKDSLDIIKTANAFVTAFNNFDWLTFKEAFTNDATIFYPFWEKPKRVAGRTDIETAWTSIFPEFINPNNQKRLEIDPKEIQVQIYGNTAIVTFHLGNGINNLSRRTLVMVKEKNNWKIAHLHASTVSKANSN